MSGEHEHVDVVVVGSGFGGSVSAYNLAADGRSVVVLERGRAWPPGSFARTPEQMSRNFWDPSEGQHGLFDIWTFRGLEGVVSSGLGGGSLIYANVLLRKDEKWFVQESPLPGGGYENWPVTREILDPHYQTVEDMIGVATYPYTDTPKTEAMREAAAAKGLNFMLPPLAVTFSRTPGEPPVERAEIPVPEYGNVHGLPRLTCRNCGECDLGCNEGSKNTLDHTYLSAARAKGADLRTRHEVQGFRPLDGGGYEVTYVVHTAGPGERSTDLPRKTITCERLVLAAGTFGTSYLLLRNVSALPAISTEMLGRRFCGNGDLLTFLLGAKKDGKPRALSGSRGPVITSAIRVGDAVDGDGSTGRGHYVEDAGYPFFTEWLLEVAQIGPSAKRFGKYAWDRIKDRVSDSSDSTIGADLAELIGDGALSNGSLPLLGMGRDVPDGVFGLRDGRLGVDWTTQTSMDYFNGVRGTMKKIADHLEAEYRDNPMWLTHRVITVHPLGGAVMGRNPLEGVCDEYGEVFGHPGLHVMDGSLLPGPVGANPSLTIAAVTDRACRHIIDTSPRGSLLSQAGVPAPTPTPVMAVEPPPAASGPTGTRVSFTEQMKGFVTLGLSDPQQGYDEGRQNGDKLMFELTITTDDVDRFVSDPAHEGSAVGFIESDALGGRFEVEQGWFNLFVEEDDPNARKMLYRLWFSGPAGNPMTFAGFKDVHDDPGLDVWRDTSTLFVTIYDGHVGPEQDADVLAAGIITIHIPDFMKQLTTFRSRGERRVHGLEAFGRLFMGQLWEVYGKALSREEDVEVKRSQLVKLQHGFGFDPQDAVRWLAPRELARAGVKAVLSAVFADYADKREIQAGLGQGPIPIPGAAPDSKEEFWFDYTADVGDGFDATLTIALLLAEESVTVPVDGKDAALPRGKMLVLGGDEVYPTASAQAYEDRMTGPYRAAFPVADPQPLLIALPGNHDWYDGLTSFLRTFTHRRSIGGWKTEQSRSYFAVQLPHRWWLVGLDSQFESYIDEPQLQYFEDNFTKFLEKGDSVILCSASPTWLKTHHDPDAFNPLFWFEKNYIRGRRVGDTEKREPTGAEVRIWLTGDSHHYARYVEKPADGVELPADSARQMVTCGIGGAYLSSTHNLPPDYRILPSKSRSFKEGDAFTSFAIQETVYPTRDESRRLVKRLAMPWSPFFLLWRNPGLFPLFAGIHTACFLGLFLLFGQGKQPPKDAFKGHHPHGRVVGAYLAADPSAIWKFALSVFLTAAIAAAIIYVLPMARFKPPFIKPSNLAAVLSQVAVVLGVFVLLGCLVSMDRILDVRYDIVIILLVSGLAAVLGGLAGGLVFGISIVCFRQGAPTTWQLSGQAIEDKKGFLRLRLSTDGTLTVFPLVVDEVNRDWKITPFQSTDATTGAPGKPVPVPRPSNELPKPRLLEPPYRVTRTAGSPTP